jgi:hypothetical protein
MAKVWCVLYDDPKSLAIETVAVRREILECSLENHPIRDE